MGIWKRAEDSSTGIFSKYVHTYNSGLSPGEYTVILKVRDVGGNEIDKSTNPSKCINLASH